MVPLLCSRWKRMLYRRLAVVGRVKSYIKNREQAVKFLSARDGTMGRHDKLSHGEKMTTRKHGWSWVTARAAAILLAGVSAMASAADNCPERLDGFEKGAATAEQIKACLGAPQHEDHNPDGRSVYLYRLKNGIAITYLFDSNGVYQQFRAYKDNLASQRQP